MLRVHFTSPENDAHIFSLPDDPNVIDKQGGYVEFRPGRIVFYFMYGVNDGVIGPNGVIGSIYKIAYILRATDHPIDSIPYVTGSYQVLAFIDKKSRVNWLREKVVPHLLYHSLLPDIDQLPDGFYIKLASAMLTTPSFRVRDIPLIAHEWYPKLPC
jgi:hypothetical protein